MKHITIIILLLITSFANADTNLRVKLNFNNMKIAQTSTEFLPEAPNEISNPLQFDAEMIFKNQLSYMGIMTDCNNTSPVVNTNDNSSFINENKIISPSTYGCSAILVLGFDRMVKFVSADTTGQAIEFISPDLSEIGEYPINLFGDYRTQWTFRQDFTQSNASVETIFNSITFEAMNQTDMDYFNSL